MRKLNFLFLTLSVFCSIFIHAEQANAQAGQGGYRIPETTLPATSTWSRDGANSPWSGTYLPERSSLGGTKPQDLGTLSNDNFQAIQGGFQNDANTSAWNQLGPNKVQINGQNDINSFANYGANIISSGEDDAATRIRADAVRRLSGRIPPALINDPDSAPPEEDEPDIYEQGGNFLLYILSYSFYLITILLGFLIDLSSKFIDFTYNAMYIASSKTVKEGWTFTRDMLNFIFILVLLAISFSTIAGLDTFNRKLLPRLLFAALLVNFSLVIGAAFLQVSNVMTKTIVDSVMPANTTEACKGEGENIGCRLAVGLTTAGSVGNLYTFKNTEWGKSFGLKTFDLSKENGASLENVTKKSFTNFLAIVVKSAMATIMIGVFAVAFIFLGLLMFVRIIALAILFILAPVPYIFALVPKAQKYADEWWSKFINYVFFLPIVTFFLALAIRMLQRTGNKETTSLIAEFWGNSQGNAWLFNSVTGSLVDVVFISIFIFAAVYVARTLSIFGANGALSAAKGTVLGAGKLGIMPARLAGGATAGLAKKGGGAAARGLGSIPYVAGGVRGARSAGRFAQRMYSGQEASAQVSEQQKAVKHLTDDKLKEAMNRGNAGAAAELMDRGELKTDEDFAKAKKLVPKNTAMGEKLKEQHASKRPVSANTAFKDQANPGITTPQMDQIISEKDSGGNAVTSNIRGSLKRMKDEDLGKNEAEVRTAIKLADRQIEKGDVKNVTDMQNLAVDLTPAKLNAYVNNLSPAGQADLQELLKKMKTIKGISKPLAKAADKHGINP